MNSFYIQPIESKLQLFLKLFFIFLFVGINIPGHCQSDHNQKITVEYRNGLEVFHVSNKMPSIVFDENKEYYWYTSYSKIKSTKGGCGGSLLDGNYKLFDSEGNLKEDINYSLGLPNGSAVRWDSLGNIISKTIYDHGDIVYLKFLNEEDYWIEFIGKILAEGSIRKVYSKTGVILSEEENLSDLKQHVLIFYENPKHRKREEYTTDIMGIGYYGNYISYYDNGNTQMEGQFYNGKEICLELRDGKWKWYDEDGSLNAEQEYKVEMEYWENGQLEHAGSLLWDVASDKWLKTGQWKRYDKDGNLVETEDYE